MIKPREITEINIGVPTKISGRRKQYRSTDKIYLWTDKIYLWTDKIYLSTGYIYVWTDKIYLWANKIYLSTGKKYVWTDKIYLWTDKKHLSTYNIYLSTETNICALRIWATVLCLYYAVVYILSNVCFKSILPWQPATRVMYTILTCMQTLTENKITVKLTLLTLAFFQKFRSFFPALESLQFPFKLPNYDVTVNS